MRILTRGDLDGLTSSVFLSLAEEILEIRFAHPKDVQDGKVSCDAEDIVVNLPYIPGCGLWFDHHISEQPKLDSIGEFKGLFAVAPSCARVIYNYYRRPEFDRFRELLEATDRLDSAALTHEDVLAPTRWILLGYTLDPRTGLGPEFQKYFRWLVEYVKEVSIEKILDHPEVRKRASRVREEGARFLQQLQSSSRQQENLIVTDLRGVETPAAGNRFLVFPLYPTANVEVRIHWGRDRGTVNLAIGHSIFNRTCKTNIGLLCGEYGGGGHLGAGTIQLAPDGAEEKIREILGRLNEGAPVEPPPVPPELPPARPARPRPKGKAPKKRPAAKGRTAAVRKRRPRARKKARPVRKTGKKAKAKAGIKTKKKKK